MVLTPVNVIQDTMEMDLTVQVRNTIVIHVLHEKTQWSLKTAYISKIWFINVHLYKYAIDFHSETDDIYLLVVVVCLFVCLLLLLLLF